MTSDPWYDIFNGTFLRPNNIENLLRRTAMYGLLGVGVAFVIITSGIDLSVGSIVCLSGVLLAIFLGVEYRAFDERSIIEVRAKAQEIVIPASAESFRPGDRIRYFGGRRARTAIVEIVGVQSDGSHSVLKVDQELSRDDTLGQIAKVLPISGFETQDSSPDALDNSETADTITMDGDHGYLAARDQIVFVHPKSGFKQLTVAAVEVTDEQTRIKLVDDLGTTFSSEWMAIPLERSQRMPIPIALLSVLSIAVALGLIHGLLTTRMKLQPFVITLCGLLIYRGLSRWLADDNPVGFENEYETSLSPLGNGKLILSSWEDATGNIATFGIPYPLFVLIVVAVLAAIFLNRTIWGRYLLALGRNEEAAMYSGINTKRIKLIAYVICTTLAFVGGALFALDANSISPSSFGNFFELYAIAAAVLGGCSLRGGEGSIVGVIIGTAVMQVLNNLIVLLKISGTLEFAIIGAVILIGVLADEAFKSLAAKRRAIIQARQALEG
ncbi:MAG: ABC transporter permease [Planctomycetales bacterium]